MFGKRRKRTLDELPVRDSRSRLELTSLARQKPQDGSGLPRPTLYYPIRRSSCAKETALFLWNIPTNLNPPPGVSSYASSTVLLFLGILRFTLYQMVSCQPLPLPLPSQFTTVDAYITSLLTFSRNSLFQTLCGGVHILDFFTRDSPDASSPEPQDLYHTILPADWISYFSTRSLDDILELILRTEPLDIDSNCPESLASFITDVRSHSLKREFVKKERVRKAVRKSLGAGRKDGEEWALNAGMKPKKIHEVCRYLYLYLYDSKNPIDMFLPTEVPFSCRFRIFPNLLTTLLPT